MTPNPTTTDATSASRLRVLIVSPYFPFPPTSGIAMRIYQLARQLAQRHDVTLLTNAAPGDEPGIAALSEHLRTRVVMRRPQSRPAKRVAQLRSLFSTRPFACRELHSAELQTALDELCAGERFDLIHVESSTMSCLRFPADVPVVIDEHNLEYELYGRLCRGERSPVRRLFYWLEFIRFRRFELDSWRRAQGCIVTSEREQPAVAAAAPATPTAVVPNGVDLEYFAPAPGQIEPMTVVFNGILDYRPNLDAATYLVDQIWPRVLARCPQARLTLVGHAPEREARGLTRPTVEVAGTVPDIRPYIQRAAVVAIPIRMGGGTRLKVVEAMSLGKAMVSTSVGCEGIAVRDREHLLLADDADAFAAAIVELFEQPELADDLGRAAHSLAEASYSWDLAGERLESLYRRALNRAAPATGTEPRVLLAISVAEPDAATRAEIDAGRQPRRDFYALREQVGSHADLLFLDAADLDATSSRVASKLLGERIGRRVAMALALFRRRNAYDVIFTDTDALGLPLALLLKLAGRRRSRCRHVTLTHNLSSMRNPFAAACKRALFRLGAADRIDTMIVHSSAQRSLAQTAFGVPAERVVLLPYQVDTAFWHPLPGSRAGGAESRPIVLVPGHECRDYPTLVAGVDGLEIDVRISTRAVTTEQAAMAARPDWPANLSFRAYDYPALRQLYADAGFVIVPLLPVDFQAGITVILEAMAMGKAVVVSAIRGQTDVVHDPSNGDRGSVPREWQPGMVQCRRAWAPPVEVSAVSLGELPTGLYVTPGDPRELRSAVEYLLRHPDTAAELGRNGRAVVEALFSIECFAQRFATAITGDEDALRSLSHLGVAPASTIRTPAGLSAGASR